MDPVSYAVLAAKEDVVILESPTRATVDIDVTVLTNVCASATSPSRVWNHRTSKNVGG